MISLMISLWLKLLLGDHTPVFACLAEWSRKTCSKYFVCKLYNVLASTAEAKAE